jgi:two-component system cell cycle response regulator
MEAGADDYHTKPIDLDELQARLVSAQRVLSVYKALATQNASLRRDSQTSFRAARVDPLTEIPNRLRLSEDLATLCANAALYGHRYCLAVCDVDDFKKYNDHFGHVAGDHALRAIASTLRDELRGGDSLYRYGGEEFVVILPEQSLDEAKLALDRVRAAVERLAIPRPPSHGDLSPPVLTLSMGVAELEHPSETDDWIARADRALYRAKGLGKNRVEVSRESA